MFCEHLQEYVSDDVVYDGIINHHHGPEASMKEQHVKSID